MFQKRESAFHEVRIDIQRPSPKTKESSVPPSDTPGFPGLRYALDPSPSPLPGLLTRYDSSITDMAEGARIEVSPLSVLAVQQVADVIKHSRGGGAALIVDYGYDQLDHQKGMDTFRVCASSSKI
jgi:hypothetical protein